MLEYALVTLLAYSFPNYFNQEQGLNASIIIDKSVELGQDPHFMVAIAWVESRVLGNRVSHTGDYGVFQINYRFWGRKWGYTSRKKFLSDMSDPANATVAAAVVLKEMRRYRSCQGLNLPACYNGGPNWQNSKNVEYILRYANKVNRMRGIFRRNFPRWTGK